MFHFRNKTRQYDTENLTNLEASEALNLVYDNMASKVVHSGSFFFFFLQTFGNSMFGHVVFIL